MYTVMSMMMLLEKGMERYTGISSGMQGVMANNPDMSNRDTTETFTREQNGGRVVDTIDFPTLRENRKFSILEWAAEMCGSSTRQEN